MKNKFLALVEETAMRHHGLDTCLKKDFPKKPRTRTLNISGFVANIDPGRHIWPRLLPRHPPADAYGHGKTISTIDDNPLATII